MRQSRKIFAAYSAFAALVLIAWPASVRAAGLFDTMLGLRRLSWSDDRAHLSWQYPLPAWAWVLVIAAAITLAGWSYRRLVGARAMRMGLAAFRAIVLLLLAVLISGPLLVINQELVEPDTMLVLVDRSASMAIRDMPADAASATTAPGASISRNTALANALQKHAELFGPAQMGRDRRIAWLGFDESTFEIKPPTKDALGDAQGQSTMLRTAIEQSLQRAAGRPIAGIVLMTDGRSPQSIGSDLIHRLQQQGSVGIFPVPIGAKATPLDLSIAQVEAPDRAFINDQVPISVYLEYSPPDIKINPALVKVRLIDSNDEKVLDEKPAVDSALREPIRLRAQSSKSGPTGWRVEVVYQAPPDSLNSPEGRLLRETVLDNNKQDLSLELVDRPVRVLYVEGYPRWEFRYLKNLLIREKSIRSATLLLSADRAFAQEGSAPIQRFPADVKELMPYDVIIIGDVPASYFSAQQLSLIREQVSLRGAGLIWIAGDNDMPRSYVGTALAALLPMRNAGSAARLVTGTQGYFAKPTPAAAALNVMEMKGVAPAGSNDAKDATWPSTLAPLMWLQSLGPLKPGAEVLATALPPTPTANDRAVPVVVRQRYGAGETLYMATDETWRWRYGRGDLFFDQYWIQYIRMLARPRLQDRGEGATLSVSSRRVEVDQTSVVSLRITDELMALRRMSKVTVAVARADIPGAAIETLELQPRVSTDDDAAGATVAIDGPVTDYEASWKPATAGKLVLKVVEPGMSDLRISTNVDSVRSDDEMRQPAPDHERLAALAKATNGAVVPLDQLDELAKLVPNRARRAPNDVSEPLGNSYLSLVLVLLLLTVEWIGRKWIRLV